jgi:hypothetical protein
MERENFRKCVSVPDSVSISLFVLTLVESQSALEDIFDDWRVGVVETSMIRG